jgi:NPCBM-associated, NEW3 domain of alpha-galactosidase
VPSSYRLRTSVHRHAGGTSKTSLLGLLDDAGVFEDTTIGLRVEQLAHDGSSASVRVSIVCAENAPTLALSPAQRGGTPGSSVSYSLSITNNDGRGCASRTLPLSVASGWAAALSAPSVVVAAGATASATLTVTIPEGSDGQSDASIVTLWSGATAVASANATTTSDGAAPSVPTNLSATAGKRQVTVAWSASSDASGPVSYRIYRDGALLGTTTYTSYSDRSATRGTFVYEVDAVDGAGNASAKSAPASVTVGGTTGRRK